MKRETVNNAIQELNTSTIKKDWAIWASQTQRLVELSHSEFAEGINNNCIKLRGEFLEVNKKEKVWIDGVFNNY